jgi:uncharacterized membrane protein YfcA
MEWLTLALSIACGGLVGFSLALTGGGGSTLAVPLLLYVVGMGDVHLAIGTSALAVSLNAYANLIPYARAGHVRWKPAIIFSALGIVGASVGAEIGQMVNGRQLVGLFAVLVLFVAMMMFKPRVQGAAGDTEPPGRWMALRLSGTGLGTGAMAGFFGVGGGFLVVPGLILSARMPMIDAIGTSLFGVGSFGLTTGLHYAWSGLIDWSVAGLFIAGGIAGGWAGASVAGRLASRRGVLHQIFAGLLFTVGIYMLVRTYLL